MALYSVHSAPLTVEYKTQLCSKSSLFLVICTLLCFICPLLITYRSEGFWKKFNWYTEQPDIHFKHQVLVVLEMNENQFIAWSTYESFNNLMEGHVVIPLLTFREEDSNRDGINDLLDFNMSFTLSNDPVHSVTVLLLFDYQLTKFCRLEMESLAYIQENSPLNGLELKIIADLMLNQRIPLPHKGINTQYNVSVVNSDSIFADDYDIRNILENYTTRNLTTIMRNVYSIWRSGRGTNQPFLIHITLRYPEQLILYATGFWEMMKWAWIQYISVLAIFILIFRTIKNFVFHNQILTTIVHHSFKQHIS